MSSVFNRIDGWKPLPRLAKVPVAVLIDNGTNSSGEATALALRDHANTRFFGARTYVNVSSNEMIQLKEGTRLLITTDLASDARGRTYPNGIAPDVAIAAGGGSSDPMVEAASTWLRARRECRQQVSLECIPQYGRRSLQQVVNSRRGRMRLPANAS